MKNVWRIGSRWDYRGAAGTSIYKEVFLKYEIVFAHTDKCAQIREGDLLAISDGYQIVAIAVALCAGLPIGKLKISNIFSKHKEYFDDNTCIGCRVKIFPLPHDDIFQYKKAGMFYNAHAIQAKVNILYENYTGKTDSLPRLCRLTWNLEGWRLPSGPTGKSQTDGTFEKEHGFGHEEWLFDLDKIIEGYHYGFLEPVSRRYGTYKGHHYDIWLYTIDGQSKKRYYVGEIKDIQVITEDDARNCLATYKKNGWIDEMNVQLSSHKLSFFGFSECEKNPTLLFNVRFLPKSLNYNDPLVELPKEHPVQNLSRYNFTHFKEGFKISRKVQNRFSYRPPTYIDREKIALHKEEYKKESSIYEIVYLHDAISQGLVMRLRQEFGDENVNPEHSAATGGRIDIFVNDHDGYIFYEIKTSSSIKASIREAMGQLMEYAQWPGVKYEKAIKKLVIVSHSTQGVEDAKKYLEYIRDNFHIPIYYQTYDYTTNTLSDLY